MGTGWYCPSVIQKDACNLLLQIYVAVLFANKKLTVDLNDKFFHNKRNTLLDGRGNHQVTPPAQGGV